MLFYHSGEKIRVFNGIDGEWLATLSRDDTTRQGKKRATHSCAILSIPEDEYCSRLQPPRLPLDIYLLFGAIKVYMLVVGGLPYYLSPAITTAITITSLPKSTLLPFYFNSLKIDYSMYDAKQKHARFVVEKATELGVTFLQPILSERY